MGRHPNQPELAATVVAAPALHCVECLRPWNDVAERWRLKVLEDDVPETVPYCPECHEREFGA